MLHFVEYLGSIISPVEWIDWLTSSPRNERFVKLRVWIKTHAPLFMAFMLRLDDGNLTWLQSKYKLVLRYCSLCGRIDKILIHALRLMNKFRLQCKDNFRGPNLLLTIALE